MSNNVIQAALYVTASNEICGFKVTNHGEGTVCAAVSILCINTVNSLEALTDCKLSYCYNRDGGYIECLLPGILNGADEPNAALLLRSLSLGLETVKETYGLNLRAEQKPHGYKLIQKKTFLTFTR
ncbi:MAG: ribosomal-processing cysteine protease Prp [Defluviitaleaceae bacterium]|nr:ribosomal-processing cysteine protease Prp [Defluviitaleaceae bacterium]MCL2835556.1 ribosomal-processing cysteine protease Prp [Defluviitaleaceae bacterium]